MNKIESDKLENVAGGITNDQAYDAALKHANATKSEAKLKKNKLECDDGIMKYEIEFRVGMKEYEYDIDANSGAVLGFEQESIFD